jgi:hypothetical protein
MHSTSRPAVTWWPLIPRRLPTAELADSDHVGRSSLPQTGPTLSTSPSITRNQVHGRPSFSTFKARWDPLPPPHSSSSLCLCQPPPPATHCPITIDRIDRSTARLQSISNTAWNLPNNNPQTNGGGYTPITVRPFYATTNTAGPITLTAANKALATDTWMRVAEDYRPFDIDVTTERPVC